MENLLGCCLSLAIYSHAIKLKDYYYETYSIVTYVGVDDPHIDVAVAVAEAANWHRRTHGGGGTVVRAQRGG